jgi:hypothetical protein
MVCPYRETADCEAEACEPATDRCRSRLGDCDLGNCSHLQDRPKVRQKSMVCP